MSTGHTNFHQLSKWLVNPFSMTSPPSFPSAPKQTPALPEDTDTQALSLPGKWNDSALWKIPLAGFGGKKPNPHLVTKPWALWESQEEASWAQGCRSLSPAHSPLCCSGWRVPGRERLLLQNPFPAAGAGAAHTLLLQTARKPSSVPNKLMNYSPPPNRLCVWARSRNRALAASESPSAGARHSALCAVSSSGMLRCVCSSVKPV